MSFWGQVGSNALNLLIENASGLGGTTEALNERKRKDAVHDFKEMEQQGIMSRVAGAKAAGLHPLAALGYQAGPGPVSPVGGEIKHMPYKEDDKVDEYMRASQIRLLNAQADEAEARARAANSALARQPGHAAPDMSGGATLPTEKENLQGSRPLRGVKIIPNEIESSAKGTTIGTHPGGTDLKIPGGPTIRMPSKAFSERSDDLDLLKYWAIAIMNKNPLLNWIGEKTGLGDVAFSEMLRKQAAEEKRNADIQRTRELNNYRARGPRYTHQERR